MKHVLAHRWTKLVLALVFAFGIAASVQAYSETRFADCEATCGEAGSGGSGCVLFANNCSSCSANDETCEIEFEGCTGSTGCICSDGWTCEMWYND